MLVVGEVRIRQVDLHSCLTAAVPSRQTQGVPQARAKQVVHHFLRHAELGPAANPIGPESQRGRTGVVEIQLDESLAIL